MAGNRTHIKTSGGASQKLAYDARGNIVGVEDGNQNRTTYRLDAWGRITGIVKADGSMEYYAYDYAGNMTSSTDGEGRTTRYEYNRAGKISAIVDPTGEKETYQYDGEDRLVARTDRNGVTVEMGYNLYGAPLFQKKKTAFRVIFTNTPRRACLNAPFLRGCGTPMSTTPWTVWPGSPPAAAPCWPWPTIRTGIRSSRPM